MRKHATAQVRAKLLLDVSWKRGLVGLAGVTQKRLKVVAHRSVEHGLRRTARLIGWREAGHARPPWRGACQNQRESFRGLSRTGACPFGGRNDSGQASPERRLAPSDSTTGGRAKPRTELWVHSIGVGRWYGRTAREVYRRPGVPPSH
jgi:hypothetical protein